MLRYLRYGRKPGTKRLTSGNFLSLVAAWLNHWSRAGHVLVALAWASSEASQKRPRTLFPRFIDRFQLHDDLTPGVEYATMSDASADGTMIGSRTEVITGGGVRGWLNRCTGEQWVYVQNPWAFIARIKGDTTFGVLWSPGKQLKKTIAWSSGRLGVESGRAGGAVWQTALR